MASPQTGIFALGTASHAYLEFDLAATSDPTSMVARVAGLREPRTTIGGVNLVAGFRPELWSALAAGVPTDVTGFNEPLHGAEGYTMPATQHDAVIWLTGASYDVVFDLSGDVVDELAGQAELVHEIVGFPYHHDLDLTGFIDGTENPTLVEATGIALVPAAAPGEGGSILLLQQWEHDGTRWNQLSVEAKEAVIGRRKSDSAELDPLPPGSHVARTDQDRFGKILRRNIAYGTLRQHGTIFVGFSASQRSLAAMLESMIGATGEPVDDLIRFAVPLTGAYYFVPSAEALSAFGEDRRA
ncbi:MAG: Dyp-type peroxidase [Chloroflexota bacterium]